VSEKLCPGPPFYTKGGCKNVCKKDKEVESCECLEPGKLNPETNRCECTEGFVYDPDPLNEIDSRVCKKACKTPTEKNCTCSYETTLKDGECKCNNPFQIYTVNGCVGSSSCKRDENPLVTGCMCIPPANIDFLADSPKCVCPTSSEIYASNGCEKINTCPANLIPNPNFKEGSAECICPGDKPFIETTGFCVVECRSGNSFSVTTLKDSSPICTP